MNWDTFIPTLVAAVGVALPVIGAMIVFYANVSSRLAVLEDSRRRHEEANRQAPWTLLDGELRELHAKVEELQREIRR